MDSGTSTPPSIFGTATGAYTAAGAPGPNLAAYYAQRINQAVGAGPVAVNTLATNLYVNINKMYKDGVAMAQNMAQATAHIAHLQRENETLKTEGRGLREVANTIIDLVKQDCGACLTVLRTSLANAQSTLGHPLNSPTQTGLSLLQRIMGITPTAAMRSVPRLRSVTTVPTAAGSGGGGGGGGGGSSSGLTRSTSLTGGGRRRSRTRKNRRRRKLKSRRRKTRRKRRS